MTYNLTYFGIHKWWINGSQIYAAIAPTRDLVIGQVGTAISNYNIRKIELYHCNNVTCAIDSELVNYNRLKVLTFHYLKWDGTKNVAGPSTNISGNISALGNKYDLEFIQIVRYSTIYGEVKSLKNLKKLYSLEINACNCTGCKSDLYNEGVNIVTFAIL